MDQAEKRLFLIKWLLAENPQYRKLTIPDDETEQTALLRGLMNLRPAGAVDPAVLAVQDAYLQTEIARRGIITLDQLNEVWPNIYLWQGDITRLAAQAIVNAANPGMTGCYAPNHGCIDNAIHTYAGMQLRQACAELMDRQGHPEPVGQAKLTPAFNLPSEYILHTVGPIIYHEVTPGDRDQLASCYHSCLELAAQHNITSLAFCSISTGEYRFPKQTAAEIALATVQQFLEQTNIPIKVIFNVYQDSDRAIYARLLGQS